MARRRFGSEAAVPVASERDARRYDRKLACNFFCQPQVPVDFRQRDDFLERLAQALELDAGFSDRARRLQPAYQVKWCCIMLNEFVRGDRARRDFARGATDADERRRTQLDKARQSLRRVSSPR